jgi:RHS repeat-associated protein
VYLGVITDESDDSTLWNPFTYTSREYEKELGSYFYRARYYDPEMGRFLGEDPIGFDGKDKHKYRYALNCPIKFKDPKGKDPLDADVTRVKIEIKNNVTDYCGSKGTEWVPELGYGGDNGPCAKHDKCYGDCNGPSKNECDQKFFEDMLWIDPYNQQSPNYFLAMVYYYGVKTPFGDIAFEKSRKKCGCDKP